ncbi:MAG: hydrogen peroxide-inducible genes activator [Pseudomonadota bacterium]
MVILPTLRQLQFFVALARRESFSRAAEDSLVSQSTLSSAIKELEALLDCQLVDRSTRVFSLTPAGQTVAEQAASLLARAEDMVLTVRDQPLLTGPFQLGIIPTIAPFLLPTLSPGLAKAYPDLQLYLREDLSAALVSQLASGFLDAAILALPYDMPGMEVIAVGHDPFWFTCGPDHPLADRKAISADHLRETPLLLLEDGHCLREHALDACQLRRSDQVAGFGGTSLMTLAEMARAGLGATLLPDMAVRQGMAHGSGLLAKKLANPVPGRDVGIVWRKGSGRAEEVQALAEMVKAAVLNLQKQPVPE